MPKVVCVGSINVDVFARAPHMPAAGETILGNRVEILPGGKGANQAVAALRMGVPVSLVGAIGTDDFSEIARTFLEREGLKTESVARIEGPTGTAVIVVNEFGENSIVVVPGANSSVSPSSIADLKLAPGDICLLQNEIPENANLALTRAARAVGAVTILNLAPYRSTDPELLAKASYLVVNEIEFAGLTHTPVSELSPARITGMLAEDAGAVDNILVTLGVEGVVARLGAEVVQVPGYSIDAVDTTGAGDAFCGAFAAALARASTALEALRTANAAAALSVQRPGAGPSMPQLDEVLAFMDRK